METDFDQFLKDTFGDSLNRLNQFQKDQVAKLQMKVHEVAKEAVKEDLDRLTSEVAELRSRVEKLEKK